MRICFFFLLLFLLLTSCNAQPVKAILSGKRIELQNYIDKLDSYRSVDMGVYYQYVGSSANNLYRIWSPIDRRYAQCYEINIQDEDPSFEMTASTLGTGIAEYFELSQGTTSGTFSTYGTVNNALTSQVGATISKTFTGTGIRLCHSAATNGGEWSFVVDGGAPIIISCYYPSSVQRLQTIATNLDFGTHTVVGTFIGNGTYGFIAGNGAATTGYNVEYKTFWIEGSDTPNYCYNRDLMLSSDRPLSYGLNQGGHYNLSFSMIKEGRNPDDARVVPVHGANPPGGATFANLTTDRYLKADGGADIVNTQTIYGLATQANEIVMHQYYKGHAYTYPSEELIQVNETWTFNKSGLSAHYEIDVLQDIYSPVANGPAMAIITTNATTLLYTQDELDLTADHSAQTYFLTPQQFDGNLVTVNKTGSDFFKSLVFAYKMYDPYNCFLLDHDYNQVLFARTITPTNVKIYPSQISQSHLTPFSFTYDAKWSMGLIPDAYNKLK